MTRRESRITAFALLFEWSFKDDTLDEIIEQAQVGTQIEIDDFARELAGKGIGSVEKLDSLIEQYSDRWKINRLSKVTLAALRLALCELLMFDDIPAGATINEAVELVKTYGTEDEASYVNGILGAFQRDAEKPASQEPQPPKED